MQQHGLVPGLEFLFFVLRLTRHAWTYGNTSRIFILSHRTKNGLHLGLSATPCFRFRKPLFFFSWLPSLLPHVWGKRKPSYDGLLWSTLLGFKLDLNFLETCVAPCLVLCYVMFGWSLHHCRAALAHNYWTSRLYCKSVENCTRPYSTARTRPQS